MAFHAQANENQAPRPQFYTYLYGVLWLYAAQNQILNKCFCDCCKFKANSFDNTFIYVCFSVCRFCVRLKHFAFATRIQIRSTLHCTESRQIFDVFFFTIFHSNEPSFMFDLHICDADFHLSLSVSLCLPFILIFYNRSLLLSSSGQCMREVLYYFDVCTRTTGKAKIHEMVMCAAFLDYFCISSSFLL